MGEARTDALRLDSDHRVKVEFHGTKVGRRIGHVGDQTPRNRDPDFGIIDCVACRSSNYGFK